MRQSSIFLFLLCFLNSFGQFAIVNETDSFSIRKVDNLKSEFYKKQPIKTVLFEKERKEIQLTNNFELWFESENKKYYPHFISENQFLIDSISNFVTIVFVQKADTIIFKNIDYKRLKFGANLKFGIIDNLEAIRNDFKKLRINDDFEEYDFGKPYLYLIKNKKLERQKKKIGRIEFMILRPEVFVDGNILTFINIKKKKTTANTRPSPSP